MHDQDDRDDYRRGPGPTTAVKPPAAERSPEPEPTPQHLTPQAIQACPDCDNHGYRGTTVCDHQDHQTAAKRGMAAIRAQMGWNHPAGTRTPNRPENAPASTLGR